MRKKVYMAGPITADTIAEECANVEVTKGIYRNLVDAGFTPFCPHLSWFTVSKIWMPSHDVWMDVDLPWLECADAVLMLPGWQDSEGACEERSTAMIECIPVFVTVDELKAWEAEL